MGAAPIFCAALVWDKSKLSRHRFIGLASRILRRRCGPEVNEWWYTQVPPRLLIEEMLLEAVWHDSLRL